MMQSPFLALNVRAPLNGECMLSILSGGLSLSNGGCFMECAFFFRNLVVLPSSSPAHP